MKINEKISMQMNASSQNKIEFANNLRGIASFSVIICHIFLLFWISQPSVTKLINMPVYQGNTPPIALFFLHLQYFNFGAFGVALFFLISGFVIPFALERQSNLEFAIGRIFRIWPTYIAGLCVSLISLALAAFIFNIPFLPTTKSILSNALLIFDFTGDSSIDGVAWTLLIEIKFYLFMMLVPNLLRDKWKCYFAIVIMFTLYAWIIHHFANNIFKHLSQLMMFLTYMFIGVCFNLVYRKKMKRLIFGLISLVFLFTFFLQGYFNHYMFPGHITLWLAYIAAYLVFFVFYVLQNKIVFPKIFNRLADISYPLYVSHSIFGWVYLRVFLSYFNYPTLALLTCLIFVLSNAYILHKLIEVPSNRIGKILGGKCGQLLLINRLITKSQI